MLYIRTGKPGHGKTLNTIREVDQKAASEGRVVYFHNINGLKPEQLKASWFKFDEPEKWFELPQDAIIVVDEAQGWFGARDPRARPPEHITRFETMRHQGHERVRDGLVTFVKTKGKRIRAIPIDPQLEKRIHQHFREHGTFSNCLNSFDKTLAASKLPVPPGQSSHVLRHTFASHFIMNGGNILTLQKILGHTSLAMTMRYAHLAPDHLQDAIRFGPITNLNHTLS